LAALVACQAVNIIPGREELLTAAIARHLLIRTQMMSTIHLLTSDVTLTIKFADTFKDNEPGHQH